MPLTPIFENPEHKPLNELTLSAQDKDVLVKIPALSKDWIERRPRTKYIPLKIVDGKHVDDEAVYQWLTEMEWFNRELKDFCSMSFQTFWSHFIFDEECIATVTSFLQEATPYYLPIRSITEHREVAALYEKIMENILFIFVRLLTHLESDDNWIPEEYLGDILYSNFLISIPMIFDMLVTYGTENRQTLSWIIHKVLSLQPKYLKDLGGGLHYIGKAIDVMKFEIECNGLGSSHQTPLEDIAIHALDVSSTISILLDVYPAAREMSADSHLEQKITKFYDNTLPFLYTNIYTINPYNYALGFLNSVRVELLETFRAIANLYLERIIENPSECEEPVERFIALLAEALADRSFVVDYQRMYPVQNDIDILEQACRNIDSFKIDFIKQAYSSEDESYLKDIVRAGPSTTTDEAIQSVPPVKQTLFTPADVQTVLDVLPHLEPNFVRKLLPRYDNAEQVIAAVLDGNIPPDLDDKPEDSVTATAVGAASAAEVETLRELIDEFALDKGKQVKAVFMKGVQVGQPKNLSALLDDKTFVRDLKLKYQEYGNVVEEEYDDEYDDSYDAMVESESKATDRNKLSRNFVVDEVDDEEDEDDDDEENSNRRDATKDFCENPEDVRARYAASRNAKYGARLASVKPKKMQDVVGKPKGQGQDKEVVKNRHNKDVNKSAKGNHNRRQGASYKRSRGMIPS